MSISPAAPVAIAEHVVLFRATVVGTTVVSTFLNAYVTLIDVPAPVPHDADGCLLVDCLCLCAAIYAPT